MFLEKLRKKWNDRKIFFLKPKRSDSLICVSEKEICNKSGILIGLNYPNSFYSLNGCVNDVKNGDSYLKTHGYDSKFLDDSGVTNSYNVLEALEELGSNDSKYVFFHYSGHGTQQVDKDGDEADGMDEVVYSIGGKLITDDEINKTLSSFPEDKIVFLIFDCCHSGTIADLPYISSQYGYSLEKVPKFVKAKVICLSGCKDNQTSADVTEDSISYGALSSTLYNILRNADKNKKEFTWKQLHKQLVLEMSFKNYTQRPQLTASDPALFDQIVKF